MRSFLFLARPLSSQHTQRYYFRNCFWFGIQPRRQCLLSVYLDIILWFGGPFRVRACIIFRFFFLQCCYSFLFSIIKKQYSPSKASIALPNKKKSFLFWFECENILHQFFRYNDLCALWWNYSIDGNSFAIFYIFVICFLVSQRPFCRSNMNIPTNHAWIQFKTNLPNYFEYRTLLLWAKENPLPPRKENPKAVKVAIGHVYTNSS